MGNPVKLEDMDYGFGAGAVSNNGGVLICGGEKNVMSGPLDNSGGKVYKYNIFLKYTALCSKIEK